MKYKVELELPNKGYWETFNTMEQYDYYITEKYPNYFQEGEWDKKDLPENHFALDCCDHLDDIGLREFNKGSTRVKLTKIGY